MRFLSPSSRLVVVAVAVALVALAFAAKAPAGVQGPSPTVPLAAVATGPGAQGTFMGGTSAPASGVDMVTPAPVTAPASPTNAPIPTPHATPKPVPCQPTDQDSDVYNPDRLQVAAACIYVTGTIGAVRREADGDLHLLLNLDPAYTHYLTPANQGEELGDLVIEPVCVKSVTQVDAESTCAADPDPMSAPFPVVGERVWMEGRYVFDLQHGGWAELHPLYRWSNL